MKGNLGYKLAIGFLLFVILAQWVSFARKQPKRVPVAVKKAGRVVPSVKPKAKIAFVIDDWGYNLNNMGIVRQIKYPFTAAILPHLSYSKMVASVLHEQGKEVILHLPMEPQEKYRLEKNTIMVSMDARQIKTILEGDLADLEFAKGVSNHMGSRATADARVMEIVFKGLKKMKLYFLDSYVTSESVCKAIAKKIGVPFAKRSIFLDNKEDPAYITGQIYKLKIKAKLAGSAVGIGHDRKITLEVLRDMMPQLTREGYSLVFVSELSE